MLPRLRRAARRQWLWFRDSSGVGKYTEDAVCTKAGEGSKIHVARAAARLASHFFGAPELRRKACCLAVAVTVILVLENLAVMRYSNIQKKFMTALQAKDLDGFYNGIYGTLRLIGAVCPLIGLHNYLAGVLKMCWREALVKRFARRYLAGETPGLNAFYRLTLTGDIDNPDQRICQDVSEFVDNTFDLITDTVGTVIAVTGFSVVLYRISPEVCLGILVYASLGTVVATLGFGPWIMQSQGELVQEEAGLRYTLIRTRENAESIAFFQGGPAEWGRFLGLFADLMTSMHKFIVAKTGMTMFNRAFHYATIAIPALLVGPRYVRGEVEFGTITQTSMAFNTILGGLMIIMNRMEKLSGYAVRVRRLYALDQALAREESRAVEVREALTGEACIASQWPTHPTVLGLRAITVRTPARLGAPQQTLMDRLSLQVQCGQSVLIAGQSGIGKSSMLRALAGLWTDGSGRVELLRETAFFMPQRPYMFQGSLRDQLLYPQIRDRMVADSELEEALQQVNLGYLLDQHGLWETKEWASLLSLGEQQRINFARILLRKGVNVALLDEGTSACDPANEAHLYGLLRQHLQSFVSVGHRPALRKYHTHALWLQRPSEPRAPAVCAFYEMAEFEKAAWGNGHE